MASARYLLLLLLAVLFPPFPVFLKRGCSQDLLLSILLTLFLFIPGIVHAMLIIYLYEESHRDRDAFYKGLENGYGKNGSESGLRKEKFRSSFVAPSNTVVPYPPGRFQGYAASGGGGGGARPFIPADAVLLEPAAVLHRGWYA
jgi:uncharacterized membrane protein YqaE (UPF0057 family)